ncbi:MAG TPA: hypothetical protein VI790_04295 [Candidatus Nanoarchaeia archaeon]|nr:hypothetical protein [Candidatus Nanoarchaeia archaeon]
MKTPIPGKILGLVLALLLVLIIGAFFLTSFGRAQSDVSATGISLTEAQCQGKCQNILGVSFNFNSCDELMNSPDAQDYIEGGCTYPCMVTVKSGVNCRLK